MAERGQPGQSRGLENNEESTPLNQQNQATSASGSGLSETGDSRHSEQRRTANRGFAAMDPEKQKKIASEGGRAAHKQGVAHEWSKDEARAAGRKGGQAVSQNREHMSEIGRKGGQSSGQRRQRSSNDGREELL